MAKVALEDVAVAVLPALVCQKKTRINKNTIDQLRKLMNDLFVYELFYSLVF